MAKVVGTEPALNDLVAIADYIALDNPRGARELVQPELEDPNTYTPGTTLSLTFTHDASRASSL